MSDVLMSLIALLSDARESVKKAADADCVCGDWPQRCKYCAPHRALLDRIDAALEPYLAEARSDE